VAGGRWDSDGWVEDDKLEVEPEAEVEEAEKAPEPEPEPAPSRHVAIPQDRPEPKAPTAGARPKSGGRYILDDQGNRVRVEEPTRGGVEA